MSRLEQFNETTGHDFEEALKTMDEDNLKGLVLDLRGNPGGLLNEAVAVADHLLPKGDVIVSHHGRASAGDVLHGAQRQPRARLSDRGAGEPQFGVSASEIVSGALQDHDRAWILGDNTFGKGLVQTVYPLVENTGLALTTAQVLHAQRPPDPARLLATSRSSITTTATTRRRGIRPT